MAHKVWRIPVLQDVRGEVVKVWKPRLWLIDEENDFYEPEVYMNAFNEGLVDKKILLGGLNSRAKFRFTIRKDDGDTKSATENLYRLLLTLPTILETGEEVEMKNFIKEVKNRTV